MLYLKLLHFIGGYDTVKIKNDGERAIDLLRMERVPYEKVRRDGDGALTFVSSRHYRSEIRALLDKNEIKVYSIYGHGLPALFDRYKRRPGIAAGAVIVAAVLSLSTKFIWNIEIYGDEQVLAQQDEILDRLSELGCKVGSFIPKIDFYSLCSGYLAATDDTAWISVNIIGTTAEVRVLRRQEQTDRVDESRPANLIATADGVVEFINTYSGAAAVHDGDTVIRGQLLISGVVEDKNDLSSRFVHAAGVVMAKTYHELNVSVPLAYFERVYDDDVLRHTELEIFGHKITLRSPDLVEGILYEEESERHNLCILNEIELPLTVRNTSYHPYVLRGKERSEEAARLVAEAEMAALIESELGGAEILSRETESKIVVDENGDEAYMLTCKFRCIEDIAKEVPITVTD